MLRSSLSLRLAVAAALVFAASPGFADDEGLEEIVVKGQIIKAQESAYTATVISQDDIRAQSVANVDEIFDKVPGMSVRDLQLGGVASNIVIRGFGSGGHGGDLGVVLDGIPLNEAMSHADGYVDLNVVTPLEIDSFTVFLGPVSALYGNFNRGGLVSIQTRKTGDYAEADLSLASEGTIDLQGAYGSAIGKSQQVNLAARYYTTDGYRPQSRSERLNLSGRWRMDVTERLQLALSGRYHTGDSDSASYLTQAQFVTDPYGIDPNAQRDGAEKNFATLRADVNYELTPELKLLTYAYTTQQDFTRWFSRPVDATTWRQREETYDRSVHGVGTSLNGLATLAAVPLTYTAGIETVRESTEYQYYEGTIDRRRTAPPVSDRGARLNNVAAFGELEAKLHELAQLSLGLRADRYTGGCERLGPETGSDPCGRLNDATHVSPKIGLRSQVAPWLQLRASWAEGFALPNGFVKYSIGGQPLDETVFRQTELGFNLGLGRTLTVDVAAYRLESDGEVRTVSPGVYENYGATKRQGIDATLSWAPLEQLELRAVYGLADTEIEKNADARLVGLEIAGVPDATASLEFDWSPIPSLTLSAAWRYVGEYRVDALNTLQADSYDTLDLGVAWRGEWHRPLRVYARVENVTDETYATSVSVIGGQVLVAPGAPRQYRVGVQVDF